MVETVALVDPLNEPVTVAINDGVDVGEVDIFDENVNDVDDVPSADCDTELVPQNEALWELDHVPHTLAVVDGDVVIEADVQPDSLYELDTDEVPEAENSDDTVVSMVSVPEVVWDAECELQGDAVKEPDTVPDTLGDGDDDVVVETVPHALAVGDEETDLEPVTLTEPLMETVPEGL